MSKKTLKILAGIAAVVIIIGLIIFANAMIGNPVSKMLANRTAEQYLKDTFPDTDFYVECVDYSFKDGCYHARILSDSSVDSEFSICLTATGKIRYDMYEERVLKRGNTADRLYEAYRDLTDSVFEHSSFPYTTHIAFGDLEFISKQYIANEDVLPYAIVQEDLELDRIYDIPALGAKAGHLVLYIEDDNVTLERAAEIMLHIKRIMDASGVPFYAMDFHLDLPKNDDGAKQYSAGIDILNFLYNDIYEENMLERVTKANEETIAYFAKMDAEK